MITKNGKKMTLPRLQWYRKPQTQVVPNKKAEEKKSFCRKKGEFSHDS